ncbi:hypothetical protein NDU88_004386 [Pleurodeles waltl]|uniref:Uncharacterized protein n=1 Tax=Pleurodeles waltl TaxID=8319 RepID=A0AAV7M887_PLEWA|nr:hypothetical protein NDU88_004386 [Pleurodeles waltl]
MSGRHSRKKSPGKWVCGERFCSNEESIGSRPNDSRVSRRELNVSAMKLTEKACGVRNANVLALSASVTLPPCTTPGANTQKMASREAEDSVKQRVCSARKTPVTEILSEKQEVKGNNTKHTKRTMRYLSVFRAAKKEEEVCQLEQICGSMVAHW